MKLKESKTTKVTVIEAVIRNTAKEKVIKGFHPEGLHL